MLRSLKKPNTKKQSSFFRGFRCLLVVVGLFWGIKGEGQQAMERVYADSQTNNGCSGILCTTIVDDEGNAADNDLTTYSTLSITLVGIIYQQLNFPEQAPAGTPVRIKVGTATDLLSLLGSIKAQAYMGNTAVGNDVALSSLLSLLGGEDQDELVFVPTDNNGPVAYNAVRITSSGIALGGGFRIYGAYFYKPIPGQIACDEAIDVLYGSTGNIAGALNATENELDAIDNDETTYATIRANVSALNKTHLTALFPIASSSEDFVKIILENPDGGLLDANVLATNFTIRTYLDNTDNGALALDPALLRLSLFPGSTGKQVLLYPITQPFNRIQVSLGEGLATALDDLLVYEITRLSKGPDITGLPASGDMEVCEGDSINLSIENPETGTVYNWYTQPTGGTSFTTGMTYNPVISNPGDYTYYVSATKSYCTDESDRTPINIKVKPIHGHAEISISNIQD